MVNNFVELLRPPLPAAEVVGHDDRVILIEKIFDFLNFYMVSKCPILFPDFRTVFFCSTTIPSPVRKIFGLQWEF